MSERVYLAHVYSMDSYFSVYLTTGTQWIAVLRFNAPSTMSESETMTSISARQFRDPPNIPE